MPVPTFLGVVAAGNLYETWDGGSIADSLDLTTLIDVPAATEDANVVLAVLFRWGPVGTIDNEYGFDFGASFSDDSAEDGAANSYSQVPNGGDGANAYGFGTTFFCTPDVDIGQSQGGGGAIGGSVSNAYECTVTRAIPSGSTFSCALSLPSGDISYFSVTVLAFQYVESPQISLSARTIDPTNTSAGDGSGVPLGDREFADIAFGQQGMLCAVVFADDSDLSGHTVAGTETVSDGSGDWTQVDNGGVTSLDDYGGYVFGVFVCDLETIDPTDAMVQFAITGGLGTTFPDVPAGVSIYMFFFDGPVASPPAFNRVVPIT